MNFAVLLSRFTKHLLFPSIQVHPSIVCTYLSSLQCNRLLFFFLLNPFLSFHQHLHCVCAYVCVWLPLPRKWTRRGSRTLYVSSFILNTQSVSLVHFSFSQSLSLLSCSGWGQDLVWRTDRGQTEREIDSPSLKIKGIDWSRFAMCVSVEITNRHTHTLTHTKPIGMLACTDTRDHHMSGHTHRQILIILSAAWQDVGPSEMSPDVIRMSGDRGHLMYKHTQVSKHVPPSSSLSIPLSLPHTHTHPLHLL